MPSLSEHHRLKGFTFLFYMTFSVIVTFFPLYFERAGFSKVEIGLFYSIGPLIAILSNLLWGLASDRFQTVKKLMILALIGQLFVVLILFRFESFYMVLLGLSMFYFFLNPMIPLNDSLTMLTVGRGHRYAAFRLWGSLGFAVGALFFGYLLRQNGLELLPSLILGCITAALLMVFFLTDRHDQTRRTQPIVWRQFWQIAVSRKFIYFLLIVFLLAANHRMNDAFLSLVLSDMGASDAWIGGAWMIAALSEIPVFYWLSRHGDRYSARLLLTIAGCAYVFRSLLMAFLQDPLYVIPIQLLHSITFGVFLLTALRMMQTLIPDQFRASGQALFTITWGGLAGLFGGVVGGVLYQNWGSTGLYLTAAAMAAVATFAWIYYSHIYLQKSSNTSLS